MITGAHSIIYSTDPVADRAFIRDVLGFPHIDEGGGWLIFGLPSSEVAVHPSGSNDVHEFYLMCDDINAMIEHLRGHDVEVSDIQDEPWGDLVNMTLPGGGLLGVYQPKHDRPPSP